MSFQCYKQKWWLSYTSTIDYNTMTKLLFKKSTPTKPHHKTNPTTLLKKNECCQHIEWSQFELIINQQQF